MGELTLVRYGGVWSREAGVSDKKQGSFLRFWLIWAKVRLDRWVDLSEETVDSIRLAKVSLFWLPLQMCVGGFDAAVCSCASGVSQLSEDRLSKK